MNEPQDPEAAETVQTTNVPAVDLPRLVLPSSDFEAGPWSYDLYADGLEPVALLNNPNHSQGEWVSIEDYRKMEHERNMARATANTFRQCAEITFGVMPFPRKFHWENTLL
jgi:hypothetical protein